MLRIRLRRAGKKKQPMYRIVVADSRAPRDGAFVESLGYYHPLNNPSTIVLDHDRARLWLDRGAQPSERVAKLLAIEGLAELSPKLKARIELGQQRAKEAAAKPREAPAAEEKPAAEAKAPAAEAEAVAPAAEAEDEAPAAEEAEAEAPAAAEGEAAAAEEAASEKPPTEQPSEPEEQAGGEGEEEKPEA